MSEDSVSNLSGMVFAKSLFMVGAFAGLTARSPGLALILPGTNLLSVFSLDDLALLLESRLLGFA